MLEYDDFCLFIFEYKKRTMRAVARKGKRRGRFLGKLWKGIKKGASFAYHKILKPGARILAPHAYAAASEVLGHRSQISGEAATRQRMGMAKEAESARAATQKLAQKNSAPAGEGARRGRRRRKLHRGHRRGRRSRPCR